MRRDDRMFKDRTGQSLFTGAMPCYNSISLSTFHSILFHSVPSVNHSWRRTKYSGFSNRRNPWLMNLHDVWLRCIRLHCIALQETLRYASMSYQRCVIWKIKDRSHLREQRKWTKGNVLHHPTHRQRWTVHLSVLWTHGLHFRHSVGTVDVMPQDKAGSEVNRHFRLRIQAKRERERE